MANYQIVMSKGPTPGKYYHLTGLILTIGRDINAEIVINIPEVSRRHAQFRLEGGTYLLEDLGSTNGTFVNGQRLSAPHRMREGDTIMLGEAVTLMFKSSGSPDPNATVVASSSQAATMVAQDYMNPPQVDPAPMYGQDQYQAPPPPPPLMPQVFPGTAPASSMAYDFEPPTDRPESSRTWLYAGIGCLVMVMIGCIAAAVLFDTINLYCEAPFENLFSFLYTCP